MWQPLPLITVPYRVSPSRIHETRMALSPFDFRASRGLERTDRKVARVNAAVCPAPIIAVTKTTEFL